MITQRALQAAIILSGIAAAATCNDGNIVTSAPAVGHELMEVAAAV